MDPLPLRLICWKWLRFTGVYFHPGADTNSKHWRTLFLSPEKMLGLSDLLTGPQPRMVTMISLRRISEVMFPVQELPKETVIRVLTTCSPKLVVEVAREQVRWGLSDRRSEIQRGMEKFVRGIKYTLPVWNEHCSCHCRVGTEECQICLQLWSSKQDWYQSY